MHDGGFQPYRRGARTGGTPLQRMVMGKPLSMPNPMDAKREAQKRAPSRQGSVLSVVMARMAARHGGGRV